MDRHDARIGGARHACGHCFDHAMDGLIASDAKNCCAQDRVGVAVDHDLHEPFRFAFFDCAADAGHWAPAYADRMALRPGFGLAKANPTEWRINIERVNGNAVAHLARGAVEQVRCGDLEIIVRSVGEGAAAVAIAERPDVRNAGLRTSSTTI